MNARALPPSLSSPVENEKLDVGFGNAVAVLGRPSMKRDLAQKVARSESRDAPAPPLDDNVAADDHE
jgi:hypothetical protein